VRVKREQGQAASIRARTALIWAASFMTSGAVPVRHVSVTAARTGAAKATTADAHARLTLR